MKQKLSPEELQNLSSKTLRHYDEIAAAFWEATKDHDVNQNYQALLQALPRNKPLKILDLGCGPGRDLKYFKEKGHHAVGLDGSKVFCEMARNYSGCEVLQQDFLTLVLPAEAFDGIFANATLFHIPEQELIMVLKELHTSLKHGGILFTSNPRQNSDVRSGTEEGTYLEFESYRRYLETAGFEVLDHYYRPPGKPLREQPWLAVVSKK